MRKSLKNVIAILLCCVFALSLFACNNTSTSSPSAADTSSAPASSGTSSDPASAAPSVDGPITSARDSATVAITQDRGTLDPLYTVGWDNQQCLRCVYEPLWEFNQDYTEIKWVLATSLDDSDPLHWIVTLRDDVTFANGNKFTAEDVVFSLYLANNRKGEPPYFTYMDNDATKVIDEYTVELVFTEYNVTYKNGFDDVFMYDKESYDMDTVAFETNGTGPYKVADYVIQSNLDLTLRDDYWGELPPIKNLSFKVLMEDAQRVNALETGEVDVSIAVPFQDVEYVQGMDELNVVSMPARSDRAICFNVTNPDCIFYGNLDARFAVIHAINPESILKIVYNGYGTVSRGPYSSNAANANPDDLDKGIYDGSAYNPELAKQLAESSGLTDVNLVCINNGSADMITTSELVQQALKEIGVNMEVRSTDAGSWLTYRFDDTTFDLVVDFTNGLNPVSNITIWWQYCGNCGTDKTKTPPEAAQLRDLNDKVTREPDMEKSKGMVSTMVDDLVELCYFYNMVEMVKFEAHNKALVLPHMSNDWFDWSGAYWTE